MASRRQPEADCTALNSQACPAVPTVEPRWACQWPCCCCCWCLPLLLQLHPLLLLLLLLLLAVGCSGSKSSRRHPADPSAPTGLLLNKPAVIAIIVIITTSLHTAMCPCGQGVYRLAGTAAASCCSAAGMLLPGSLCCCCCHHVLLALLPMLLLLVGTVAAAV